jgi:hypothetical protein
MEREMAPYYAVNDHFRPNDLLRLQPSDAPWVESRIKSERRRQILAMIDHYNWEFHADLRPVFTYTSDALPCLQDSTLSIGLNRSMQSM